MPARRAGGFTYVGLIVLVAIIGLVGAAALKVDALLQRAAAERELLEIGAAFSEALRTYAEATPRGQPTQPPSLQDLLRDPRVPGVRRHLRKIFVDPITGKAEWGIVWVNPAAGTGVLAVYSLSQARPLKVANFDARFQNMENKDRISEWKFAATGQSVAQGTVQGQAAGQGAAPGAAQPSLFQPAPAASQPSLFQPAPAAAQQQGSLFAPQNDAPAAAVPEAPAPAPADASSADGDDRAHRGAPEDRNAPESDDAKVAEPAPDQR